MDRFYFDYAAATPVDPEVVKEMNPYWSLVYGNAGALNSFGQEAGAVIFDARKRISKLLNCDFQEIIFTGSATEANNLALRGVVKAARFANKDKKIKIIVSAIEHDSILATCRDLIKEGVEIVYLPVDKSGLVDLKKLEKALDENTVLVSVMYANNEIGTVEPIKKISEIIKKFKGKEIYPLFHTDAVQAFNYLNCDVKELEVDLMTLSAQKIYGPKGAGLLYCKNIKVATNPLGRIVSPIITGGEYQEFGLRAGTENVPAIVGMAKAMEITGGLRQKENQRLGKLQEYFWQGIEVISKKAELNGPEISNLRLPNNLNIYLPKNNAQDLLMELDLRGFAVSAGSACSAKAVMHSHVLKALGYSSERAMGLRISLGRQTTKDEIDKFLTIFKIIIKK